MQEGKLSFGGRVRTFKTFLPNSIKKKWPLVLNLHGGGAGAYAAAEQTQMNETAKQEGFALVYPEGTSLVEKYYTWNAGSCCGYAVKENIDDVGYISSLIDILIATGYVDDKRIYVTGMSNGAMMAYRLSCELSTKIAAMCAVSASMGVEGPKPIRAVPVMEIHGLEDPNAPFKGGVGANAIDKVVHKPVQTVMKFWYDVHKCQVLNTVDNDKFTHYKWFPRGQEAKAPLELYAIKGGGHVWFGGKDVTAGMGTGNMIDFPANKTMWEFFKKFSL